jgi:hypothetical protein
MDLDAAGTIWIGGVNELGQIVADDSRELIYRSLMAHLHLDIETIGDVRRAIVMPYGVYFQTDAYLMRWHQNAF